MIPLMIMIGADKGGVGKTTVARVVIDYLAATRKVSPKVFDSEYPTGVLARFKFTGAEIVDMSRLAGRIRVFDSVDQGSVTVVDMRAGLMSGTLRALDEAGLLAAVRANEMNLALLHVLGPTPESLDEIMAASKVVGGGSKHFMVKNNILATAHGSGDGDDDVFAEWASDPRYAATFAAMEPATITVPRLAEEINRDIQKASASFVAYTLDKQNSRTKRNLLLNWLRSVWSDLDKVGLGELAAPQADAAPSVP